MKKLNQFLQLIVLAYFGMLLLFLMGFDTLGPIFKIKETTPKIMTSFILFGATLLAVQWGISFLVIKEIKNTLIKKEREIITLKAKLYDLDHPKLGIRKIAGNSKEIVQIEDQDPASEK